MTKIEEDILVWENVQFLLRQTPEFRSDHLKSIMQKDGTIHFEELKKIGLPSNPYSGWKGRFLKGEWPWSVPPGKKKKRKPQLPTPKKKTKRQRRVDKIVNNANKEDFLDSYEWRKLRMQAIKKYGNKCMCCGSEPPDVVINVDHIKPRKKYPELALDINNLQILCNPCNHGKGNWDETDWRSTDGGT